MPPNYVSNEGPSATTYRVTASELKNIVKYIEHLNALVAERNEEKKEFMAQVKARGYDTKIINAIVKLRQRDPDEVAEEEALLEMYREALGV